MDCKSVWNVTFPFHNRSFAIIVKNKIFNLNCTFLTHKWILWTRKRFFLTWNWTFWVRTCHCDRNFYFSKVSNFCRDKGFLMNRRFSKKMTVFTPTRKWMERLFGPKTILLWFETGLNRFEQKYSRLSLNWNLTSSSFKI